MNHIDDRDIRGRILRILEISLPYPVTERTLFLALSEAGYEVLQSEIPRHMDYLRGKDYVESEKKRDKIFGVTWHHKLSPKGNDLLNGYIDEDPGISIPSAGM